MGRQYEYDDWLEFLTGSDDQPDYAKKTQKKFEDRVEVLVDKHLPDDAEYPMSRRSPTWPMPPSEATASAYGKAERTGMRTLRP